MTLFGLGNPGDRYAATRHNVGFMVLDELARRLRARFRVAPDRAVARARWRGQDLVLVKPLRYMNESGLPVAEQLREEPGEFLVVCDDFALPFGRLRLRPQGSEGGHNGLASIIYRLGTNRFPRLRVGIGTPPREQDWAEYVLEPFSPDESARLAELVGRAADACLAVVDEGLAKAMNRHNLPTGDETGPADADPAAEPA
ncbi:MAG: aminoacyl-tRNA hydrolase [bacterium]